MGAVQSAYGALAITGGTITGNLAVTGTTTASGGLAVTGATTATEASAGATAYAAKVTGDAANRLVIGGDGKVNWGAGAGAPETPPCRVGSQPLQTDGTFQVLLDQNVGGNINAITVGKGLAVKEGSNAKSGTSVLVGGTVVVANTAVTATSRIQLTSQVDGGTPGFLRVSTRTAATSFTILSSSNTDTSTVAWLLVEPA
jgi:hypothetical protein